MALIILVDYAGTLGNLQKLARDISPNRYEAIYLIAVVSEAFKDLVCVTLKNPSDTLGPINVSFNRRDGVADVARMH
jgi:hypothetical protein